MLSDINLPVILAAAFIATASPGPSTLGVAGLSMASGRKFGLAMVAGVITGSVTWSTLAALGFGAAMRANVWLFEALRYAGAAYLLYLAVRSAWSAWLGARAEVKPFSVPNLRAAYFRGLTMHLTNPKAILFFASLFALGIPPDAPPAALALVVGSMCLQSTLIFTAYVFLFSSAPMARGYLKLKRWFEAAFAAAFGAAAIKILTTRV
ncbi:MAG TPA: LysE family translocator [Rhabdaerophilum sp.]|nr:LysE family translocator [Rhabdaerophilum sp.]